MKCKSRCSLSEWRDGDPQSELMHSHGLLPLLTARARKYHCSTKYNSAVGSSDSQLLVYESAGEMLQQNQQCITDHVTEIGPYRE